MTTSNLFDEQSTPPAAKTPSLTAAKIREKYDDGVKAIKNDILTYQENSSYVEGQQWVYRHNTRHEILNLPRNPKKVRATISRLGPESRRIFSKLLKRPLVFEVTPDAADDAAVRGAAVAQGVLTSLAKEQKWERLREELAWAMWKGGTGILCLDWDKTAGRDLGQATREGDIKTTVLTIAEVATEPGTKDVERANWWVKAQALPPDEVKKQYNLPSLPPANTAASLTPTQSRLAKNANGEMPMNLTLVLTYYERPNTDTPQGVVATVVGEKIVEQTPWPFPFTDRLNLVCARETIIEGRWTGHTVVSDAVPIQTALNHAWTSILEHLKQAGNARLQNNSMERQNAENWSDEAGEFIFHDGDEAWQWVSPPPMPDWWQRLPGDLAAQMDDTIGVHEVSRGEAPVNIESGLGLSILAEQDDTPTGKMAQTLADVWGDYACLVLGTYEAMVPANSVRTATITEPGQISEKIIWDGSSFAGQTNARVPFDAVAPMNEAARFARGMAFLDRGIIQNPRQLSAYIDLPGNTSIIESIDPNVAKARRENYEMATGEIAVPAQFDNHQTHIEEHNAFRLSARYERLDDKTRQMIDMHVQAHSTLAAEEAAMQQARMMSAPMLAQAAGANQMPGQGTLDTALGTPGPPKPGEMPGAGQPSDQAGPLDAQAGAQMGGDPSQSVNQQDLNMGQPL